MCQQRQSYLVNSEISCLLFFAKSLARVVIPASHERDAVFLSGAPSFNLTLLQETLTGSAIPSEDEVMGCSPCCLTQCRAHSGDSGSRTPSAVVCGSATVPDRPHCPSQRGPGRGLPHHPGFLFGVATGSTHRRQEEDGSLVGVLHSFPKGCSS